jgi:molybdopterin/thiamine biosynthesis adenylyltransferase
MLTHHLTMTGAAFRGIAAALAMNPALPRVCPAGVSRLPERVELLLRELPGASEPVDPEPSIVVFRGVSSLTELAASIRQDLWFVPSVAPMAFLAVGLGAAAGHLAGFCVSSHKRYPLTSIRIVAPGIPLLEPATAGQPDLRTSDDSAWSRTIGALGEEAWRTLQALHVGIIGCGRTGSLVANSLRRTGVRRIALIDPDRLEPHNIGEMDVVTEEDVPLFKVEALARRLRRDNQEVVPVPESVVSLRALVAVKLADVLISCADNGTARLATALLAKLYLKPLLDIGTGILFTGESRRMGADVRLVLPGQCLVCFGGIADFAEGRSSLLAPSGWSPTPPAPVDWRRQRTGSLRSLNQLATGMALRIFEDFLAGRIEDSTWIHIEIDAQGIPVVERRTPAADPSCLVCSLGACADEGVDRIRAVLERAGVTRRA